MFSRVLGGLEEGRGNSKHNLLKSNIYTYILIFSVVFRGTVVLRNTFVVCLGKSDLLMQTSPIVLCMDKVWVVVFLRERGRGRGREGKRSRYNSKFPVYDITIHTYSYYM